MFNLIITSALSVTTVIRGYLSTGYLNYYAYYYILELNVPSKHNVTCNVYVSCNFLLSNVFVT